MNSTLAPMWHDLMQAPSIISHSCVICGATYPLNQHHIVPRSAGNLFDSNGNKMPKPTVTLCGSGNTGGCHGMAHSGRLHFRYVDSLEYIITEPCDRLSALSLDGWRSV